MLQSAGGGGYGDPLERSPERVLEATESHAEAAGIADGDLVELIGKSGAPLRAWAVTAQAVAVGCVPLDGRGRSILGLAAGDPVHIRRLTPAGAGKPVRAG